MTPFAIAGLQLDLSPSESNLSKLSHRIAHTIHAHPATQMVLLSELATYGPSTTHAESLPGPAEEAFRALAAKHKVWLVPGSLFERSHSHVFNTASVINPAGEIVGRYRKLFPFRPYEVGVEAGDQFLVFDVPDVGRFGLSICYDLWFPEVARTLAALGAEVILHPCMTTTIDRDVELSMARAQAAMNQCFIWDINGLGAGGNGRSIVVGPDGDVLHQAGTTEEDIVLEIDLDRVRRGREVGILGLGQPLKSFRDRRVDFGVYARGTRDFPYLESLGPLEKPTRGTRAGLDCLPTKR